MGKIQRGVNISIDAIMGLFIVVIAYQYFWGELGDDPDVGAGVVLFVFVILAAAGWVLKIVSGLITRPMDALRQKVNEIPVKDGE